MLLLMLMLVSLARSSLEVQAVQSNGCHPWSFYNVTLQECQCYNNPVIHSDLIKCSGKRVLVKLGNCMTNEEEGVFIGYCRTFLLHDQNVTVTDGRYIQLPDNSSELNDYVCGPMNRKGRVCSKCIDGFAPSVTSIGYELSLIHI